MPHTLLAVTVHKFQSVQYCNVFIISALISAHSHLNTVSGGKWQLLVEPWRVVEGAAVVQRPTTSTIPQRVITVECLKIKETTRSCITEVVIPYESWRSSGRACLVPDISVKAECPLHQELQQRTRCAVLGIHE